MELDHAVRVTTPRTRQTAPPQRPLLLRALGLAIVLHGAAMLGLALPHLAPTRNDLPPPETVELTVEPAPTASPTPEPAPPEMKDAMPAPTPAVPPTPAPPAPHVAPEPAPAAPAPRHPPPLPKLATRPAPRDDAHRQRSLDSAPPSPPQAETPQAAPPPAPSAEAVTAWRGALARWLQAHETYPEAARRDGAEGRVIVRFTLDPSGAVDAVTIVTSSGSPVLDAAALAMLQGARLPPPPTGEGVSLTLPVRYSLAR